MIRTWSDAGASTSQGFTTAQVGDVDGDGAVDLVHVVGGKLHALLLPWRKTPDRLELVKDGSVGSYLESFDYTRQWWGDSYAPVTEGSCEYPLSCTRRGFSVVRKHRVHAGTNLDGTTKYRTDLHQFQGPKSNLRGRGFLGFQVHKIRDRERGAETIRYFDNTTPFDTNGSSTPGGEHHPYAGRPYLTMTVTPRTPMASASELASTDPAPGLTDNQSTPARITSTSATYDVRTSGDHDRILTVLPTATTSTMFDHHATPVLSSASAAHTPTPSYDLLGLLFVPDGVERIDRRTTTTYDPYGNAVMETSTTVGGVTTVVTRIFDTGSQPMARGCSGSRPARSGARPIT